MASSCPVLLLSPAHSPPPSLCAPYTSWLSLLCMFMHREHFIDALCKVLHRIGFMFVQSYIAHISQEMPASKGTESPICSDDGRGRTGPSTAHPNPTLLNLRCSSEPQNCGLEGRCFNTLQCLLENYSHQDPELTRYAVRYICYFPTESG